MDIDTRAQQGLGYPAARLSEKGCLPVWGGNALIRVVSKVLPYWARQRVLETAKSGDQDSESVDKK